MARLEGPLSHNEQGRRGGDRVGLNFRKVLKNSAADFDSATVMEAQRFGEALLRSVQSWRHREARRQEGTYERA